MFKGTFKASLKHFGQFLGISNFGHFVVTVWDPSSKGKSRASLVAVLKSKPMK